MFEPYFDQMLPALRAPYRWAMSDDGKELRGMVQRFGPYNIVVNSDKISRKIAEEQRCDLYGQVRDSASQVADAAGRRGEFARKSASAFETALRETIENSPYTAVAIGVGLGWLLGRTHRPL
jgi:ElaB/YqjD/DUF883 family membrane-anchored ribosome-binding protein